MKYYIIAGERSGDLHGANLIKEIIKADANAEFRCWGGDYMAATTTTPLVRHYADNAVMGVVEVVNKLPTIWKNIEFCKKDLIDYKPDALILIDYAGFNLRIAKFAHQNGIKVFYYISPKIWAWNQSRVKLISKYVDKMLTILPFETDFYQNHGYKADYVGNPVADAISEFVPQPDFYEKNQLDKRDIIAILPGSRRQEIDRMLHFMLSIHPSFSECQLVVAAVGNLPQKYYEMFRRNGKIKIIYDQTYDVLYHAKAAVVTSGTATLETALFNVPQVVCYQTSMLTYWLIRASIKVKYISLVNLIADRLVVKELIQDDFNPSNLIQELHKVLDDTPERKAVLEGYKQIMEVLGQPGASAKAANIIWQTIKKQDL